MKRVPSTQPVSTNARSPLPSSWDEADLDNRTAQAGWNTKAWFDAKTSAEAKFRDKHFIAPSWSGPVDSKQVQPTTSREGREKNQKAQLTKHMMGPNHKLRPSERLQTPKPAVKEASLGHELLAAIKGGVQLKHVEQVKQTETQSDRQILATNPLLTRLQERRKKYVERCKGDIIQQ